MHFACRLDSIASRHSIQKCPDVKCLYCGPHSFQTSLNSHESKYNNICLFTYILYYINHPSLPGPQNIYKPKQVDISANCILYKQTFPQYLHGYDMTDTIMSHTTRSCQNIARQKQNEQNAITFKQIG